VSKPPTSEEFRIEQSMGNLLRYGVLFAALVTAVGGAVFLWRNWDDSTEHYHNFGAGAAPELRTPWGVAKAAAAGGGRAWVQLGAILLIAVPVARVVFSVYAFARMRDRLYVVVTLIVLTLLLISLFSGVGG
jgi:uncharacterized membrane protein